MYRVVLSSRGFEVWKDALFIYAFSNARAAERFIKTQNRLLFTEVPQRKGCLW